VEIKLNLEGVQTEKEKKILEDTAKTCPVLNSLHPDMEKEIVFNWK
ncbi:MAG TPA: osmotically inducible protein OsmC, partial [Leeuwenhoekiella sp.]|nr:osmotically inducible protein OsmC [Leeuwenhoekiella sp.]